MWSTLYGLQYTANKQLNSNKIYKAKNYQKTNLKNIFHIQRLLC